MYEIIRVSADGADRCASYLDVWRSEGCTLIEMSCAQHDEYAASTQFTTHLVARMVAAAGYNESSIATNSGTSSAGACTHTTETQTPIDTPSYSALRAVSENLSK